jgi:hypothetical protein
MRSLHVDFSMIYRPFYGHCFLAVFLATILRESFLSIVNGVNFKDCLAKKTFGPTEFYYPNCLPTPEVLTSNVIN